MSKVVGENMESFIFQFSIKTDSKKNQYEKERPPLLA